MNNLYEMTVALFFLGGVYGIIINRMSSSIRMSSNITLSESITSFGYTGLYVMSLGLLAFYDIEEFKYVVGLYEHIILFACVMGIYGVSTLNKNKVLKAIDKMSAKEQEQFKSNKRVITSFQLKWWRGLVNTATIYLLVYSGVYYIALVSVAKTISTFILINHSNRIIKRYTKENT